MAQGTRHRAQGKRRKTQMGVMFGFWKCRRDPAHKDFAIKSFGHWGVFAVSAEIWFLSPLGRLKKAVLSQPVQKYIPWRYVDTIGGFSGSAQKPKSSFAQR